MFGGGTTDKDICHYPSAPSLASGSALFFYFEIDTLGTGTKITCGMAGRAVQDHQLQIDDTTHILSVVVTEDSGGGYANPIDGLPEETTSCAVAVETGGRVVAVAAAEHSCC